MSSIDHSAHAHNHANNNDSEGRDFSEFQQYARSQNIELGQGELRDIFNAHHNGDEMLDSQEWDAAIASLSNDSSGDEAAEGSQSGHSASANSAATPDAAGAAAADEAAGLDDPGAERIEAAGLEPEQTVPLQTSDFVDSFGDQFESTEDAEVFYESFLEASGVPEGGEISLEMAAAIDEVVPQMAQQFEDGVIPSEEAEQLGQALGQTYEEFAPRGIDGSASSATGEMAGPDDASGVDAEQFAVHNSDRFGGSEEDAAQFYNDFAQRNNIPEGETPTNAQLSDLQREAREFAAANGFNAEGHAPGQTAANPEYLASLDVTSDSTETPESLDRSTETGVSADDFTEFFGDRFEDPAEAETFYNNFLAGAGVPEGESMDIGMAQAIEELVTLLADENDGQIPAGEGGSLGTQAGERYATVAAQANA